MIIADIQQTMIAALMINAVKTKVPDVDENMIRHMILSSIRTINNKFKSDYGELVIACDSKNYWRRDIFPYYKHGRVKSKENQLLDWKQAYSSMNKIKKELKENFPYRVIEVEGAEADDVIAVLCENFGNDMHEPIMIVSADHDFNQLHKYLNIRQYDPIRKKKIECGNPERFLLEHIIKGDSGDSIPNIMSDDNVFVIGQRQKPVTQKRLDNWRNENNIENEFIRNFHRNKTLIDFNHIPSDIKMKITQDYETQKGKRRDKLLNYFIEYKLSNLTESLTDF
jgi:5'-3' exonuclease